MGIQGLLPFLKEIRREIHLSELRGLRIAVDGYVWLHRAAFGCALELMQSHETSKYVDFFMRQVYILKEHEIEPVIVFDGAPLPMKRSTEIERRQRRDQQRAKGMQLLRAGKKLEAIECFQRSVNITPVMAYHVIKALKHREINFVVAPYEADAQMAYLERTGYVDAVLSEDSDLLVFGVKRLITKLDRGGNAIEICGDNIMRVSALAAQSWNFSKFRQMCIMSGCDYLASPHGIGLQKAAKFLENKRDAYQVIQSWINWGKAVKAPDLPPNYEESFRRAEWTFLHQRVFDPESRSLAYLTPLSLALTAEEERGLDFLGPMVQADIARGIALGELDPETHQPFEDIVAKENRPLTHSHQTSPVSGAALSSNSVEISLKSVYQSLDRPNAQSKSPTTSTTTPPQQRTPLKVLNLKNATNINASPQHKSTDLTPAKQTPQQSRFFSSATKHTAPICPTSPSQANTKIFIPLSPIRPARIVAPLVHVQPIPINLPKCGSDSPPEPSSELASAPSSKSAPRQSEAISEAKSGTESDPAIVDLDEELVPSTNPESVQASPQIASVREENTGPSHPSSSATQVDDPSSDPDPVYIPQSPVPPASPAPAGSEGCRTATVGTASKYFKAAVQQPESLPSAAPISTMPASTESQRRSLAGLYKPVSLSRIVSINGPSVAAKVAGRSTSPRKNLAVGLRRKGL